MKDLTSSTEIVNPVIKVNEICQAQYGKNILFTVLNIGNDSNPQIHVKLTVPWGEFEHVNINQKIAKAKVAEIALNALYNQSESML